MKNKLTKFVFGSVAALGAAAVGAGVVAKLKQLEDAQKAEEEMTGLEDVSTRVLKTYMELSTKLDASELMDLALLIAEPEIVATVLTELVMREEDEAEPADEAEPVESADEAEPAESAEEAKPAEKAKPAEEAEPAESAKPADKKTITVPITPEDEAAEQK